MNTKIVSWIVGTALILLGITVLFLTIWTTQIAWESASKNLNISYEQISVLKVIKNYHLRILVPLCMIFSGITLAAGKRIGWVSSIICLSVTILNEIGKISTIHYPSKTSYSGGALVGLAFLLLLGLLLTKQFRTMYNPGQATWITIITITVLIVADNIFLVGF